MIKDKMVAVTSRHSFDAEKHTSTILCISKLPIIVDTYLLSANLPKDAVCVNQTNDLPYTLCSKRLHTANTILPYTADTPCAYSRLQGETTHKYTR